MAKKTEAAVDTTANAEFDEKQFADYEEEQIGFPPYWKCKAVGDRFVGRVVNLDLTDPEFERFVVQAGMTTECSRGPVDESIPVTVKPGEYFSVSLYGGLRNALLSGHFLVTDDPIVVECIGKQDTGQPSKMYTWRVRVSPRDKKLIEGRRAAAALGSIKDDAAARAILKRGDTQAAPPPFAGN
jgi:hypothetical protein